MGMIGSLIARCERHARFATEADAEAERRGNPRLLVFRCHVCAGFHLGRPGRRRRFRSAVNRKGGR